MAAFLETMRVSPSLRRLVYHSPMDRPRLAGAAAGLTAAFLFGVSAPLAKLFLPSTDPLMIASLLYLGAGIGLSLIVPLRRGRETPLQRRDLPALLAIILCGGIAGPLLMLWGLRAVPGVIGSLLLNLEAVFTIALALVVFREHLARSEAAGAALILLGAAAVGFEPGSVHRNLTGSLLIAGACLAWAVDNNLTQRLTVRDPIALVRFKTLGAGILMLTASLLSGTALPSIAAVLWLLLIGVFSYGVSIVLDAWALRILGAAREAAFFATAPFIGAIAAVPILRETPSIAALAGGALMVGGVAVLLRAHHSHPHTHQEIEHEHLHSHDAHHAHEHPPDLATGEPHSHPHRHAPVTHDHPHLSDVHHRHEH